MRVLLLNWRDAHHPEGGGAEKYIVEVATGLARAGHEVTFRTAAYPGALAHETVDGVHYVRKGGHYSIYLRALAANLLNRYRADVVVDVQNGVPYLSPMVRRGPVVNLVHHVHREQWPVVFGPRMARFGWWLESWLAPRIYRHTSYVAVSDSTKHELVGLGVSESRIRIIHNGTDAVADHSRHSTANPVVMVLGRLVPQKRVEFAIDAVAELAAELPDVQLWVVGSGYWEHALREHAADRGVADRVHFHCHVSEEEKHRLLAEAWVLAMPSIKEGWGLVVVEAGVHGTPTVAFDHAGGPTNSIRDEETGLLVHGGGPEFTAALRRVLTDEDLRSRLSSAVVGWVARFHWDESVKRWEELLDETVRAGRERKEPARA